MWSSACVCQTLIWVNNVKFSHAIPSVCVWDTWQSSTFTLLTTQREVPPCYTLCVWDTSQSSTWLHNVKFRHAVPCVSINFVCEHGPWFRCRRNFVPPWRDERLKLHKNPPFCVYEASYRWMGRRFTLYLSRWRRLAGHRVRHRTPKIAIIFLGHDLIWLRKQMVSPLVQLIDCGCRLIIQCWRLASVADRLWL